MSILTNKLDIFIDRKLLSEKYDLYEIATSDEYIKSGSSILDCPELNNDVKAVFYKSGRNFYVLLNHDDESFYKLKNIIDSSDLNNKLTIKQCLFSNTDDYIIVQLLLNALGTYENNILKSSNLTGHLYAFNTKWSVIGKYRGEVITKQVICLEIDVTPGGFVQLPVRTFTNIKLKHLISFKKRRFEDYPQYVYSAKNTLRRKIKDDNVKDIFILRQIDGKKSDVAFLDISSQDAFEASKTGMLWKIIDLFNTRYQGFAKIVLYSENVVDNIDYNTSQKNAEQNLIHDKLVNIPIRIIDEIESEASLYYCENIRQMLVESYGNLCPKISINKKADKESINIIVIHNKQFYIDIDDAYDQNHSGVVQHITLEDFSDSAKFAIRTVINEALIKKDLQEKKITLFPWKSLVFKGDISFGTKVVSEDSGDRYFFMKISPDGSFSFVEQELNLFEMTEYYDLVDIYETDNSAQSIRGIIKDEFGNINIIRDTGWFTLPELDKIAIELHNGNTKLRGKTARDELLSGILDIKLFEKDGFIYYFSGTIGNGMKAKVENSANIRRIEKYHDSELIIDKILPLMDTALIRNGQLTVLPYPFKYLREYINSLMKIG